MNGTFAQFGVSGRAGPFPPDPRQLLGLFLAVGRILGYGILSDGVEPLEHLSDDGQGVVAEGCRAPARSAD